MRHIENWDAIQEKQPGGFNDPKPGGYISIITSVIDKEDKEYLEIQWDYLDAQNSGANEATYNRAGFWPAASRQSYKDAALSYFKAFKTAVEKSNPGYIFDDRRVQSLVGKKIGVVTGLEEYRKNNGDIGQRVYVYQVRSIQAIQSGDFTIPEMKKLKSDNRQAYSYQSSYDSPPPYGTRPYNDSGFAPLGDNDMPF